MKFVDDPEIKKLVDVIEGEDLVEFVKVMIVKTSPDNDADKEKAYQAIMKFATLGAAYYTKTLT